MTATINRPALPTTLPTEMYEIWRSSMETMNWSQDQADTMFRAYLDQARTLRHDGTKVMDRLAIQAKDNAEELVNLANTNMKAAMDMVPGWDAMTGEGLKKQFDDFAKKLEALYQR